MDAFSVASTILALMYMFTFCVIASGLRISEYFEADPDPDSSFTFHVDTGIVDKKMEK